jgi:uncharacterized protein YdeI (YjbR/CyaY-like superfamily)
MEHLGSAAEVWLEALRQDYNLSYRMKAYKNFKWNESITVGT